MSEKYIKRTKKGKGHKKKEAIKMLNKITKTSKQIVLFFESSFVFFRLLGHYSRTRCVCDEVYALKCRFFCLSRKEKSLRTSLRYQIIRDLVRDNRNSAISLSHPVPNNKTVSSRIVNLQVS